MWWFASSVNAESWAFSKAGTRPTLSVTIQSSVPASTLGVSNKAHQTRMLGEPNFSFHPAKNYASNTGTCMQLQLKYSMGLNRTLTSILKLFLTIKARNIFSVFETHLR